MSSPRSRAPTRRLPSGARSEKYAQMEASPFAFFRGSNHLYWKDLGSRARRCRRVADQRGERRQPGLLTRASAPISEIPAPVPLARSELRVMRRGGAHRSSRRAGRRGLRVTSAPGGPCSSAARRS
ncbi:DUF2252 family protein [Sorangium sp. So ce136]|uniref:DUF2252 family protein n=1 Tax=Sorangium sp. So ce136 TaxID=3133284 RepID=UPI003F527AC9